MQPAKKQVARQLINKVVKVLDDPNVDLDILSNFLNAAANFMEQSQTIEVMTIDELREIIPMSENHARNWSKVPGAPVVWVGASLYFVTHQLFNWLSVPQNFADIAKYKSA